MNYLLKIFFIFLFILILPLLIIVSVLIWYEDGFPVIFSQERLGLNKKKFTLYKIRTMQKSTPNLGTHEIQKIHHLKFGTILRNLKIDELPQLINYIKDDLNLIGPRPGLPNQQELKKYREKYDVYDINPGITGLAQVLNYDMSNPKLLAKIDSLYIKDKSNKLDVIIFFATFFSAFRKKLHTDYDHIIKKLESN